MLALDNQNKLQVGVQDLNMTNLKRNWETGRTSQMQQNGTATKNGDWGVLQYTGVCGDKINKSE